MAPPVGVLDCGAHLVHDAIGNAAVPWSAAAILFGAALTGATVLRATGRIFLNLGPDPGDEAEAPSQAEQEKADRPLWLMLAPCLVVLALALSPAAQIERTIARAVDLFASPFHDRVPVPAIVVSSPSWLAWTSVTLALAIAGLDLFREHLPRPVIASTHALTRPAFKGLKALHSGLVGDYVLWIVLGLAAYTAAIAMR